jgi:hypothetical protein
MNLENHGQAGWEPTITSYCAFCKTPHGHAQDTSLDESCAECRSPLYPPPPKLLGLARRALARLERDDPVTLFVDWPDRGVPGQTTDLSPTGMRCKTRARLDANDVVKVTADRFDAVGSVAHVHHDSDHTHAGLRFLTVRFPTLRGNFTALKV